MIIQNHAVSFRRVPLKENKGIIEHRWSRTLKILLNLVFPIDMFYDFSLLGYVLPWSVPLAEIDICANENLC